LVTIIESSRNRTNWEDIYYEWLAWSLPLDLWQEAPDHVILKTWIGVKKVKQNEVNALSISAANLAALAFNYMRDPNKGSSCSPADFLPFEVEKKYQRIVTEKTAKIFIEVMNSGLIPPNIINEIMGVEDLYESIFRVSNG
jgi:hypothetical protein